MPSYTLADYYNIQTSYGLPDVVQQIIHTLIQKFPTSSLGFTTSVQEPKQKNYKQQRNNKPSDESWQTVREFKTTTVVGNANKTNDIRVSLNKLSIKNYDTTSEFIISKLKEIHKETEQELPGIITVIIDTMSSNKVFSQIYAKFYKKLLEELPELFSSTLDSLISNYIDSISKIHFADPNIEYDEFCKTNKENDKRKATALFLTNLAVLGQISIDKIFFITNTLMDLVQKYMVEPDKIYEVEEITENIFIMLTTQEFILNNIPFYMKNQITEWSQMKNKQHLSLTSRTIFKYVDICENT